MSIDSPASAVATARQDARPSYRSGSRLALGAALAAMASVTASSWLESAPPNEVIALPESLEIELARSALPPYLRDGATVYVYDADVGYRVAVDGSNGFHALVGRDDPAVRWAAFTFEAYPRDFLIPVAFDEAARNAQLKAYLDLGRWRAEGVAAPEAQRRLREGFEHGEYETPARTGVGYMLSPIVRAFVRTESDATVRSFSFPHYMFFAPHVSAADIGAGPDLRYPVMRPSMPDPHGMIVVAVGERERAAYAEEHARLLARLCEIHEPWCLP